MWMRCELWHADPPNFFGHRDRARVFPTGYRKVAVVECEPARVFAVTQHLDHDWTQNPEVIEVTDYPVRSTSVGDVLVWPDGRREMVDWFGFWPIGDDDDANLPGG